MTTKSLHYKIPDDKPFDQANWFETFVGSFVVPIVATGYVESYWFSRYRDKQHGKHARFRVRTENPAAIQAKEQHLAATLKLHDLADESNYDGSEFRNGNRFLGTNQRQNDRCARYELIWRFLYASSAMFVDCLSHQDADGRWYLENNVDTANNTDRNTIESPHHLFCNLTGLAPRVDMVVTAGATQLWSTFYRRCYGIPDSDVKHSEQVRL